jgi:hypothetical protein
MCPRVQEGLTHAPLLGFSFIVRNTNPDIFFVEYAELRMLPFDPVVENKTYARSREILTSRFQGAAGSITVFAVVDILFSTAVENSVENSNSSIIVLSTAGY